MPKSRLCMIAMHPCWCTAKRLSMAVQDSQWLHSSPLRRYCIGAGTSQALGRRSELCEAPPGGCNVCNGVTVSHMWLGPLHRASVVM